MLETVTIPRGARGWVRYVHGSRVRVVFDTACGAVEETVSPTQCRVIRHGVEEKTFLESLSLKVWVRTGALIVVLAPMLFSIAQYWWATGSLDGVVEWFAIGAVEAALALPGIILQHPGRAALWLSIGALTCRLAFGPPPRTRSRKTRRGRR
ncbi:hypothetical protein QYM41_16330 [Kocuria sp. CPCC 205268]|uniref:hypothetical protein n=1 Tax=Kocuria oxytropis TaxID=3058913 RepID=UPI0034D7279A